MIVQELSSLGRGLCSPSAVVVVCHNAEQYFENITVKKYSIQINILVLEIDILDTINIEMSAYNPFL